MLKCLLHFFQALELVVCWLYQYQNYFGWLQSARIFTEMMYQGNRFIVYTRKIKLNIYRKVLFIPSTPAAIFSVTQ